MSLGPQCRSAKSSAKRSRDVDVVPLPAARKGGAGPVIPLNDAAIAAAGGARLPAPGPQPGLNRHDGPPFAHFVPELGLVG